jgi:hypothetical protein
MPLDELTKKRRTRAAHRGSATKIGTKIKECLANASETPQTDKNVLIQLRDTLSEKLEALKLFDNEIVEVLRNSEAEDAEQQLEKEIQETDDTRAELQKIILDVNDVLFEALPSLPQGQSTPSNMNAIPKQIVRARLPKLEVKRFNGKIQEWHEFWDSFDSSVNQNDALSEVDKFVYLKGLLVGPAQTTIAGFTLTATNYKEALELLKTRYGKKTAIQRAHNQALMNIKPVYNERDVRRLRELYHACETNCRGLKTLGVDESSYATIVVPEILDKLPESSLLRRGLHEVSSEGKVRAQGVMGRAK